jgi:hypothetical protein
MKRNWKETWAKCTDEELDNLALLRVMECTNGVIQHMFRDQSPLALTVEETRVAMKFSMSSIKNLEIPLGGKTIKFKGELAEAMRDARDLYIQGVKHGDDEAFSEFMVCSATSAQAVGKERIQEAVDTLMLHASKEFPHGTPKWGQQYLSQFFH